MLAAMHPWLASDIQGKCAGAGRDTEPRIFLEDQLFFLSHVFL